MKQRVTLVAEVSSNHGGSLRRAQEFMDAFMGAGADLIKFQFTNWRRLAKDDPQREWFKIAQWEPQGIELLIKHAERERYPPPMWTVYHPDDVCVLAHHPHIKVGAGEAHSGKLAEAILEKPFQRIYVSEGIRPAHKLYAAADEGRVILLGTVSHYPAPQGLVGSRWLSARYAGWSDHCVGLNESCHAAILGATTLERHVQLRNQARSPKPFESTVEEFQELRKRVDHDPDQFLGRWNHGPFSE